MPFGKAVLLPLGLTWMPMALGLEDIKVNIAPITSVIRIIPMYRSIGMVRDPLYRARIRIISVTHS